MAGTIVNDEMTQELSSLASRLIRPVTLLLFTRSADCGSCEDQKRLLTEIAALLGPKVRLEVHDLEDDPLLAARFGIKRVPATLVSDGSDRGIRFYGPTGGHEIASLIDAIVMASLQEPGLDAFMQALVREIDRPAHLEVLVTLTCPYCSLMVRAANKLAYVNGQIRADMIVTSEFPELVERYDVHEVPVTILNGRPLLKGAVPEEALILEVLRHLKPEKYEEIEAQLREATGEKRSHPPQAGRIYDVIIVGAGPAAMSASIYAARKQLDTLVLGDEAGGQMTNTALVENWLGIPSISGQDLTRLFVRHMESHPIAERLRAKAARISRTPGFFAVTAEDGAEYRGRTVIYCAGKQYRTLNVPGESRFLGQGIGFCATCDAPLFKGKRVAVIGGGNSALTSARDLLPFADEIHLIHRSDRFHADPALIRQVEASPKVRRYFHAVVREFKGDARLTGIRVEMSGTQKELDLAIDGAFEEIGLVPNTNPAAELVRLNEFGEIPAGKDQSTGVEGFFAAGDATDVPDKQIVIAAGQGAQAALSAYEYLARRRAASAA